MSFYDAAVPAYLQMLNSVTGLLTKAEAHCAAKKIDPSVLLGSRLFPDMLPLSKQVQLVTEFFTTPVNRDVQIPQALRGELTVGVNDLDQIMRWDWTAFNAQRDAVIERWNRAMR